MGHATNEHLAQLDLRENPSTLSDSITPIPCLAQGFKCPVKRAQSLCHTAMTLRFGHTREKFMARQTKQGQVLEGQKLCMLYELGTCHPQP
jgi:hypothetical protein